MHWTQKEHYYLNDWLSWAEVFQDGNVWKWNARVNLREHGGVAGSKEEAQRVALDWIKEEQENPRPSVFCRKN